MALVYPLIIAPNQFRSRVIVKTKYNKKSPPWEITAGERRVYPHYRSGVKRKRNGGGRPFTPAGRISSHRGAGPLLLTPV